MDRIWKLVWRLVPKELLKDMIIKTVGKIIDGQVKPDEIYDIFFDIGKAISEFGNANLGKNYEKFIENKLQIRLLDSAFAGVHDGLDINEQ